MGKSENYVFLEIIVAIALKVGLSIQINEFMKLNVIKGQGHYLTLAMVTDFKIRTCFSQEQLV